MFVFQAQDALSESLKCDPSCPQTHFLMFTLALELNDSQKGDAAYSG